MQPPDLTPPPDCADWTPARLPHLAFATPDRQFLEGTFEEGRLCVRYFRQPDGRLGGTVWFGPRAEGPPGHAHGGSIAAVLDEAMGGSAWLAGHPVMTREMTVRYHKAVPLGGVYLLDAGVERVEGRLVHVRGVLRHGARVHARATGIFAIMTRNPFEGLTP